MSKSIFNDAFPSVLTRNFNSRLNQSDIKTKALPASWYSSSPSALTAAATLTLESSGLKALLPLHTNIPRPTQLWENPPWERFLPERTLRDFWERAPRSIGAAKAKLFLRSYFERTQLPSNPFLSTMSWATAIHPNYEFTSNTLAEFWFRSSST